MRPAEYGPRQRHCSSLEHIPETFASSLLATCSTLGGFLRHKKEIPPKRGARFNECGKTKEGSPKGSLEVIYGQEML